MTLEEYRDEGRRVSSIAGKNYKETVAEYWASGLAWETARDLLISKPVDWGEGKLTLDRAVERAREI